MTSKFLVALAVLCLAAAVSAAPLDPNSDEAHEIVAVVGAGNYTITANANMPTDLTTCKKLGSGQFKQACLLNGGKVVLLYLTSPSVTGYETLAEEMGKFALLKQQGMPVPLLYGASPFVIKVVDGSKTITTHAYLEQALGGSLDAATAKVCSGFDTSFRSFWGTLASEEAKAPIRKQLEKIYLIYQIKVLVADLQLMSDTDNNLYVVDPDALCTRRTKRVPRQTGWRLDLTSYPCDKGRNHANTDCSNIPTRYGVTALTDGMAIGDAETRLTNALTAFVETSTHTLLTRSKRWKSQI